VSVVEPEAPVPKEYSYEEFQQMKKSASKLPSLPVVRKPGEGEKVVLPMGTEVIRKEQTSENSAVAERKETVSRPANKDQIVFGVKSYQQTSREQSVSSPSSRGDRGGRGRGGGSRGGARGGANAGRGASSPGTKFDIESDFPDLKKN
jgi:uncharacterized membrane protein YgcG